MENNYLGRPVAFNLMFKPIGPICNLNCTYCYYLEKENLYKDTKNFKMSDEVLESAIKQYIQAQTVPVVTFVWQGGESMLLGLDFFKKAVALQKKYAGEKRIENAFQTNGTLINEDWCKFFHEHDFLVGISIDGPEHIHDKYRPTKNNKGSFSQVMKGIETLRKYKVKFNTLTVVHDYNVDYPLEIYNFLKKIGSGFLQFIPIVERDSEDVEASSGLQRVSPDYKGTAPITKWSVPADKYGKFMAAIFDEWVKQDVGKYYVQLFDVTLANWAGEPPGLCVFAEVCGEASIMEHNGDIYTCDHYVYPENKVGNILNTDIRDMMLSPIQMKFGINKQKTLPQQCRTCDVRFACNGGCPKNRISTTATGEEGLNYLCPSYKYFFNHVRPYMDFMTEEYRNERPPANVMQWIREQNAEKEEKKKVIEIEAKKEAKAKISYKNIRRNDPCPCGSGKLFKNCCRNKANK